MNTNFKVIGLTRLGIKPKSTAPEAEVLTTGTSELFVNQRTVVRFALQLSMFTFLWLQI